MDSVAIILWVLLCLNSCFCKGNPEPGCIGSERQALLKIKKDLKDSSNMLLADWRPGNKDCCKWKGVSCDNATGHVTELHLGFSNGRLKLGGQLSPALLDLKSLSVLDLSNNVFDQTQIPRWFWNLTSHLQYLNISGNHFQGNIPDLLTNHAALVLDLSSNNFTGSLPAISLNMTALDLSNNALSGSMLRFLCRKKHRMKLEVLSLGGNHLSGEIPDCWEKWGRLVAIELCDNNLSGKIPPSVEALTSLQSLHLSNNSLHGEIPESMSNCTELLTLDFSANQFSGEIPPWIGERLSNLIIIGLRSNMFHGRIPDQICGLPSLQILDLSHNNLSGNIPTCIKNLTAMNSRNKSNGTISYKTSKGCFVDNIALTMKGVVFDYSTTLKLIKLVDLSDNNLSGVIPEEITTLIGLLSLNLSRNHLVGKIPGNIGAMNTLECVDLSENRLSGEIPESMSQLTFLSYLNLSYNNLTGKIPSGTQLQTFSSSSFLGNKLYGPPLTNSSRDSKAVVPTGNSVGEDVDNGNKRQVDNLKVSKSSGRDWAT
ncbi:receptor-like protein EIX2 [Hibiscus syriacus]|uniref:receptor-like protein EIX2 n=1 Tax=Hibiscus syriacus TaxID=106335 RepID=UPI001920E392|nr:receptor-like protein EIX2 [Hibiscus syriacus]